MEGNERIEGMTYLKNFISKEQEMELVQEINHRKWNTSIKRRTQHYGYKYSYDRANTLEKEQPIPEEFIPVKRQIQAYLRETMGQTSTGKEECVFDQLIINEYQPGQGISPHIDNLVLFGDVVVSLSLAARTVMAFEKGEEKRAMTLQRRALLVISGESRCKWKHSIASRKKDDGVMRGTRLSMTWRCVKQQPVKK